MVNESNNQHVALVVEDDPEIAKELHELLRSLGHDMVNVPSQEEAQALLESREFCFVFLDLQIKITPESIRPRVEVGKTLLRILRERFPARNQQDHHHLQILVMSGQAKESQDIVECLQNGADDFLLKPLASNIPSVSDKIMSCLRKSHRINHGSCKTVMAAACASSDTPTQATQKNVYPAIHLSITGEAQGKRTGIVVNGKPCSLPDVQLMLLMRLVVGRLQNERGWVHKNDLGAKDEEGFKLISLLNTSISPFLPHEMLFYDNDKKGSYRINRSIKIGTIGHELLERHSDVRIRNLSTQIKSFQ
ncbi:MAG: response regulator [Magnetococcales bacterium]|nr:response regulator [Magnetococcales bacterium]